MSAYTIKIWNYKYNDAKSSLWTLPALHLIFAILFWMSQAELTTISLRTAINIAVIFIASVLILKLNWKTQRNIYLILTVYLLIFVFEIILLGIPEAPLNFGEGYGKGFMTIFILQMLPWVYILLRFIGIFAFINLSAVLNRKPSK